MARNEQRQNGNKGGKPGRSAVKTLLFGMLLGLVVAAVMAWYLVPRENDFRAVESAPVLRVPPTSIATPAPAKPAPVEPETASAEKPADPSNYTFYDILPGDKTPKPQTPAKPEERWWLQVAALKNAQDADALRAKLFLLNLSVVVQPTEGGQPLYRVRVGPFDSQAIAESTKDTLTVNKFEARLLKEPVIH